MLKELQKRVPAVEKLEENFEFVKNDVLRANIAIAFQYIIFCLLVSKYIEGPLCYSTYKSIIIHTSSIVESLIHYCLRELIDRGVVDSSEVMGSEWKLSEIHELFNVDEFHSIVGASKKRIPERLTGKSMFITLNRAAKRAGIFDDGLYLKAEELRTKRNFIHLAGLENVDDYYKKDDVDHLFKITAEIRQAIEEKLKSLT
jgi:hypothetical protein